MSTQHDQERDAAPSSRQESNEIPDTIIQGPDIKQTSDLLEKMVAEQTEDTVSIDALKSSLHERGFGVLMAIAALPLCIPVPVPPGYTTLFAIPLFILSVQMIWGMDSPWIPSWLARKRIKRKLLAGMVLKGAPVLRKIERLVRPRMTYISLENWEKVIGLFSFVFSLSIAIPLPLTNLPPGYGILIMSLGLLGRDGVTIIIGIIIGIIGVGITAAIIIYGTDAVMNMFDSDTEAIEQSLRYLNNRLAV